MKRPRVLRNLKSTVFKISENVKLFKNSEMYIYIYEFYLFLLGTKKITFIEIQR